MSDRIVELNVGGTPYTTKMSTLMKTENGSCVLRQLIEEGAKDSQVGSGQDPVVQLPSCLFVLILVVFGVLLLILRICRALNS